MDLLKFAFNQIVEELVSDLKYRINSDNQYRLMISFPFNHCYVKP